MGYQDLSTTLEGVDQKKEWDNVIKDLKLISVSFIKGNCTGLWI